MEDERMAQMEAMREEMRMELQKQKEELEAAAAAAQFEAEEAARKRERELQEQRDAELAKRIAEETQDPPPSPPQHPPAKPLMQVLSKRTHSYQVMRNSTLDSYPLLHLHLSVTLRHHDRVFAFTSDAPNVSSTPVAIP
jgi:hypothetical protein